ncbi:cytochrome P450 [Athelia psychrophila]|uniref:Cytochrome P450 n=1 Tax=Athelia psychrophila TaxID=1759441 RepID=A0A166UUY3_9AGAM|nr:cytochrome P450 [Fibularhizoctonia sp. CBS 109695]
MTSWLDSSSVLTSLAAIFASWIIWLISKHFFVRHALSNIPGPPCPSFIKGHIGELFSPQAWDLYQGLYDKFGTVVKVYGFFGGQHLYVCDPKALQHILVKDQDTYEPSDSFIQSNKLLFGNGLVATMGDHHRRQRKLLNPVFSSRHLAEMIPVFYEVTSKLRDSISEKVRHGPQDIDMLHWLSRTALELIGQSGLGHSFDDLGPQSRPNEYTYALKNLAPTMMRLNFFRMFLRYVAGWGTPGFRRYIVERIPMADLQKVVEMVDTMYDTSIGIFMSKKAALAKGDEAVIAQVGRGKDIMSVLLKANLEASIKDRLPEDELIAQISIFTFAAFDTTSSALSRILHLLSQYPDVQTKLRREITAAREYGGDLDYNGLDRLPYLDAVIRETLRLFPPVPIVSRLARKDMVLPLSKPMKGADGMPTSEIFVPKGTMTFISVITANRNPEIWGPDSYEWKPERWLSALPTSVTDAHYPAVYANLMTFIGGSRACIGFKFSELEMKVVLSLLLESFTFAETKEKIEWNTAAVMSPVVADSSLEMKPRLPLIVTAINRPTVGT